MLGKSELVLQPQIPVDSGKVLLASSFEPGEKLVAANAKWQRVAGVEPAWLTLDHHAPRPFFAGQLALHDLLNEDEETAPGRHRVTAVRREANRFVLESSEFWLGTTPGPMRDDGCLLFAPRGTYNGDTEADSVEIVALTWGPRALQVRIEFLDTVEEQVARPNTALTWRPRTPLPSGDFDFTLSCRDAKGNQVDAVSRTITVNRDAPKKVP